MLKQYPVYLFFVFLLTAGATPYSYAQNEAATSWFEKYAASGGENISSSTFFIIQWKKEKPAAVKIIRQLDDHTAVVQLNEPGIYNELKQTTRISAGNDACCLF